MEFQLKHKDDLQIAHIANNQNLSCATFSHSAALNQHLSRGLLPPTVASAGRQTFVSSPSTHFVILIILIQIRARYSFEPAVMV